MLTCSKAGKLCLKIIELCLGSKRQNKCAIFLAHDFDTCRSLDVLGRNLLCQFEFDETALVITARIRSGRLTRFLKPFAKMGTMAEGRLVCEWGESPPEGGAQ